MSAIFWIRLTILLPTTLGLQFLLRDFVDPRPDAPVVSAYVVAIGTLYSVLAAFTVVSVWQEFNRVDSAIKREAVELGELWRNVGYVSDAVGVASARTAIERYRDAVLTDEWPAMVRGEPAIAANAAFDSLADAGNRVNVTTHKDVPAWAEAVRSLGAVADARAERVFLASQRMPMVLRLLLYVATASLLGGIVLLGFESIFVGAIVATFTVIVSLMMLEVINDIDDPFGGSWTVTSLPFERIRFGRAHDPDATLVHDIG